MSAQLQEAQRLKIVELRAQIRALNAWTTVLSSDLDTAVAQVKLLAAAVMDAEDDEEHTREQLTAAYAILESVKVVMDQADLLGRPLIIAMLSTAIQPYREICHDTPSTES
jgi:hypothetical protein